MLRLKETSKASVFTLGRHLGTPDNGVAIVYGWLWSKPKYLCNYANIYSKKGFDVIVVAPRSGHVMRPHLATSVTSYVSEAVMKNYPSGNIFLHAFSMGGYLTAVWLDQLRKDNSLEGIERRVVGQCYDSPVDYESIPRGIALAAFRKDGIMCSALEGGIRAALAARPQLTEVHKRASDTFWHRPMPCPSLWMVSDCDPISPIDVCEKVMAGWEKKGMDVRHKMFHDSKHCTHYRNFKSVYASSVSAFVDEQLKKHEK